jgi:prepilin-type N-terminal cleavage/methylation domain-containing protein
MIMKRRGFTLVEVLVAATVIAMISGATLGMISTSIKSFTYTNNQYDADMGASTALQLLNRNLQEAKQVSILSPTSIRINYLQKDANGIYIRNAVDETNYVDFYRGNTNLTANSSGTCLIRRPAVGQARAICKNVTTLEFRSFTPSSVDVTLRTEYGGTGSKRNCQMIHRAIFLRNY